jgi:hypothetical protein
VTEHVRDEADEIAADLESEGIVEYKRRDFAARIRALIAKVRLNERRKVAEEIVRPLVNLIHRYAGNGGDWACRVCRPASDILEDGFLCSLHRAESWLASLGEPTAPEGE